MADELYNPPPSFQHQAYFKSMEEYQKEYARSIADPGHYWAEKAAVRFRAEFRILGCLRHPNLARVFE